jgi:hypothetical protein
MEREIREGNEMEREIREGDEREKEIREKVKGKGKTK